MRIIKVAVAVVVFAAMLPRAAHAWSKAGHMVTGAIAYRVLKESDETALERVLDILREHPFYEQRWRPAINALPGNDPDKEGLFLFMHAARWPDDIRGDEDLHCGNCHFVNFRFRPSQPNAAPVSVGGQILSAFDENLEIVNSNVPNDEKAMAISWLFHLVGDVHQPLHAAVLVNQRFPQGDRGGTLFFIRPRPNSRTISLHKFWDDIIIGSERFSRVSNRATELRQRPEFRRAALSELSENRFLRWANTESFTLAKRDAYRNGSLQGSTNEDNGTLLPQNYASTVRPIAERRAVLAGYRIAEILSREF